MQASQELDVKVAAAYKATQASAFISTGEAGMDCTCTAASTKVTKIAEGSGEESSTRRYIKLSEHQRTAIWYIGSNTEIVLAKIEPPEKTKSKPNRKSWLTGTLEETCRSKA